MNRPALISRLILLLLLPFPVLAQARSPSQDAPPTYAQIQSFWQRTLARAAKEPLDAQVHALRQPLPYKKYRVTYRSLDGVKVRAYLSKPIRGEGGSERLPAIVSPPGYGGLQQTVMLNECQRGYIILQVYPRSQGESAELWKINGPDKLTWHISHPEGYYYQGAYVDVIRGIDYLVSRPDVDPSRIGVMGTSQGGGIVLAVAALDPRVKVVVAHVPFLCDMRRAASMRASLVKTLLRKYGELNPGSLRTLDFFDPLNLAPRIHVPVLVSAGGKDETCPAETIRAVFDRLPGIKTFAFYPNLTHTSCADFYRMSWAWMDRYLKP